VKESEKGRVQVSKGLTTDAQLKRKQGGDKKVYCKRDDGKGGKQNHRRTPTGTKNGERTSIFGGQQGEGAKKKGAGKGARDITKQKRADGQLYQLKKSKPVTYAECAKRGGVKKQAENAREGKDPKKDRGKHSKARKKKLTEISRGAFNLYGIKEIRKGRPWTKKEAEEQEARKDWQRGKVLYTSDFDQKKKGETAKERKEGRLT